MGVAVMSGDTPGMLGLAFADIDNDINAAMGERNALAKLLPRLVVLARRLQALVDRQCQVHGPGGVLAAIAVGEARDVSEHVQWLGRHMDRAEEREIARHFVLAVSRARTVAEILVRVEDRRI
jgi:hypothetical protein